jgi:hypothetical protein
LLLSIAFAGIRFGHLLRSRAYADVLFGVASGLVEALIAGDEAGDIR